MTCILCWLRPADTAEHIVKADIYAELMPDGKSIYYCEGKSRRINGRKSKKLKPLKNLCERCNSAISQKPDQTFSTLDKYLRRNSQKLGASKAMDLNIVFSDESIEAEIHLKRYFAKSLACYIHRSGNPVPRVLGKIFLRFENAEALSFKISIVPELTQFDFMENRPLLHEMPGIDATATRNLSKLGLPSKRYSYAICHSGVIYQLNLEVPDCEIAESAEGLLDHAIEEALGSSSLSPRMQKLARWTIAFFRKRLK